MGSLWLADIYDVPLSFPHSIDTCFRMENDVFFVPAQFRSNSASYTERTAVNILPIALTVVDYVICYKL